MIDVDGYRPNVGIIVANDAGQLLWAKRIGQQAWQFPQGGIAPGEAPEQAMYRELHEELGLLPEHVECLGVTRDWLRYKLPARFIRRRSYPLCVGQKQRWFALRLTADPEQVRFDRCDQPEFDRWQWVNYWHPIKEIVAFKRGVYRKALNELAPRIKPSAASRARLARTRAAY